MSHLLDVAQLRVLGEQSPYKQLASFNEKAAGLSVLAPTRSVWA